MLRTHLKNAHNVWNDEAEAHMIKQKVDIRADMALVQKIIETEPEDIAH